MGVVRQMARFIIREAKYSRFRGAALLIGRHTVFLTPEQFVTMMQEEGMQVDPSIPLALDTTTVNARGRGFISDVYFFRQLGADSVVALDVSDYEGAEIVHNLDTPIPAHLEGKFDLVYNGSVLDNVFDPVTGLRNISRLLAPGGRVIHVESASNAINQAYLQFSPNWFFDYYAVNRFADCKTYLAFFSDVLGAWDFYACIYDGTNEPRQLRSPRFAMTAVVAEKAADSTWNRAPIQGFYRSAAEANEYREYMLRFAASTRPIITPRSRVPALPRVTKQFLTSYIPKTIFASRRGYRPLGWFR
jgi:SAM-dependent methyltransferase